jgi:hypothetical protein
MRKPFLLALPILVVLVLLVLNHNATSVTSSSDTPQVDLSRLSATEIGKQSKAAIMDLLQSEKPDVIAKDAEQLRLLARAPAARRADAANSLELIAALEKGRLTLLSQRFSLRQERDTLLATIQQGNLAVEMIVAPMVGSDAYLAGIYQQYKDYSATMTLVMTSLFAEPDLEKQMLAVTRLRGMAPTAIDNIRVLSLEISSLQNNAQLKAGIEALQQMIKPEQGCIARWIWLQEQEQKLQVLAEQLQQQMSGR